MVDASILATEMIIRFQPKFIIMAGVLGGRPNEVNIGDIVVATKVFTIDKGKISDIGFKKEIEASNITSAHITTFKREKERIIDYIKAKNETRTSRVDIHFGSIACVRQVIDVDGYFEENISIADRKALALEMESYGISRACELANDGATIPLIIKSAMDNTVDKVDGAKIYAAWTSATFIQYVLENDLI
jgi:nucleoside phosphorylase